VLTCGSRTGERRDYCKRNSTLKEPLDRCACSLSAVDRIRKTYVVLQSLNTVDSNMRATLVISLVVVAAHRIAAG
jgi:hypothetical protein